MNIAHIGLSCVELFILEKVKVIILYISGALPKRRFKCYSIGLFLQTLLSLTKI